MHQCNENENVSQTLNIQRNEHKKKEGRNKSKKIKCEAVKNKRKFREIPQTAA